jgi:hypothetical protein
LLRHVSLTLQALLCRLRRSMVAHFVAGARLGEMNVSSFVTLASVFRVH